MTVPGRPTRLGIIGAGNVLPAYLQLVDRLGPRGMVELGPICARRAESWPSLLARRPGLTLVADPLEVVDADVELVLIITSPQSHAQLARLALNHGKHVVVEKPFAASRDEGMAVVRLAAERELLFLAAPFVHLSPTFRALWTEVDSGAIGDVHSSRALYGNAGAEWKSWPYAPGGAGPLADLGIYSLKSVTTLLGPVVEVRAANAVAVRERRAGGTVIADPIPDVVHVILRHRDGALSSVASSTAFRAYNRPGLELYGVDGTATLLGDDWDPSGYEIWRKGTSHWEQHQAIDPTWLWTDGLREAIVALRERRLPLANSEQDLHLLDVLDAAQRAAASGTATPVSSSFEPLNLRVAQAESVHLHDHTRPPDEQ